MLKTNQMAKGTVHISHPGGHRASYRDLLGAKLGYAAETGSAKTLFSVLCGCPKVLFATLDGDIDRFLLIAMVRSLLFRRTCGLFVGPLRYTRRSTRFREKIRGLGLRALKEVPLVTVFSIIPHPVRPALRKVTGDWIHDPQLWDLGPNARNNLPKTELSSEVGLRKGNRKVLLFLGKGSRLKGLQDLVRLVSGLEEELLVVVAGRIQEECRQEAERLVQCGMIVEDRFISDQELLSLYGPADFTWCVYAPDYDQASGVFGRSIQLGVVPLIRERSVLDDYANFVDAEAVRLTDLEKMTSAGLRALLLRERARFAQNRTDELLRSLETDALSKIRKALGED